MSKLNKLYDAVKNGKTILGVGPMSKNCIEAAIEISNENDIPIILIPSRRQVECKKLGGGYVMDTEDFVPYIREKDKKDLVFIERDHGGYRQSPSDISYADPFWSYEVDIESGFDILEIDPSLVDDKNTIFKELKSHYVNCQILKEEYQKNIIYEFEFEEHSEQKTNTKDFTYAINLIKEINKHSNIKFLVGNVGLYVRELRNVGEVDFKLLETFVNLCKDSGLLFKSHNCDYIDFGTLKRINETGVAGINVAPEFGVIETREFLKQLWVNGFEEENRNFVEMAFKSEKWIKWLDKTSGSKVHSSDYLAEICGHYIFNDPRVVEIKERAQKKFDLNFALKTAVKNRIKEYLTGLGWETK